ncbi:Gfo/Idh/MocA family oxidoreductase [Microbacterium sp. SSW1-49]|uniref:Gfo/Idh/MocA family oxidoreductase n=1 Tax=Microbacterium croceum TaxID=2851645 RepID=A0ABT0FC31_9MICO|nr:Gfo/Idh/MocA family oxidoreductase [Microbacterium croceum]MCK2035249.1 Gfo/Idh/MocA family oxidoreductase [Microbacterium croceum]
MTEPLRIAIVGAGVIGAVHARLVAALGDAGTLAAIVDVDEARGRALADEHGVNFHASAVEAYRAESIDLAAVCLPSAFHADAVIDALDAGVDVIVEKPIDVTLESADRVRAAERSSGRTVSVISQRRFQPVASFLHRSIEEGALGRVTSGVVESAFFRPQEYYDSGDWRGTAAIDGGGALMNQGIHALDLLLWMLGTPVSVTAKTGRLAHEGIEVEDVAGATIEFESGAIGLLLASTAAYPGLPVRLAVHGSEGTAVMENDGLAFFASATAPQPDADALVEHDVPEGWSDVDMAHRRQYLDVIQAIRAGRRPAITTDDGRRALQVVLAVYESARTGRPVDLHE